MKWTRSIARCATWREISSRAKHLLPAQLDVSATARLLPHPRNRPHQFPIRHLIRAPETRSIRHRSRWNNASEPAAPDAPAFRAAAASPAGSNATISRSRGSSDTCELSGNCTGACHAPWHTNHSSTLPERAEAPRPRRTADRYRTPDRRATPALTGCAPNACAGARPLRNPSPRSAGPARPRSHSCSAAPLPVRNSSTRLHFAQIFFAAHHLLAGAHAHVHFAVDASGMLRAGLQILLAAADLEQIQKLVFEQLGRRARLEGPIMNAPGRRSASSSPASAEIRSRAPA